VGNDLIWVKLHGVHVTAFSEDNLIVITTKLGTPLMFDSYTSDTCMQSWGRSSYVRSMIEIQTDMELKDTIDKCPKNIGSNVAKNLKKLSQAPRGVSVGPKVGFKPLKQVYRHVSKKNNANTSCNKKKDVKSEKKVSNPNPFDVLNSVENDVDLDDEGKPMEKVDYPGDHNSEDEVKLVDNEMASFLASKRVDYGTNRLLEYWKKTYENVDYDHDPYDDDMYEGQEIHDIIQSMCDNLDIKYKPFDFNIDLIAFNKACPIEKAFAAAHHRKTQWSAFEKSSGSSIYPWLARATLNSKAQQELSARQNKAEKFLTLEKKQTRI
nr:hypothetical protein [Tanacetum cinerariifolium]